MDRELDDLAAALPQPAIGLVAARQHVVEQDAQLRLAPAAPRLDAAEQALEVADLGGDALDLRHRFLHLRELVGDAGEDLRHLPLDRLVKLLVHRPADRGEAQGTLVAHLAQLGFEQRLRFALLAHQRQLQAPERLARLDPCLLGPTRKHALRVRELGAQRLGFRPLPRRQLLQAQALHVALARAPDSEQRERCGQHCSGEDGKQERVIHQQHPFGHPFGQPSKPGSVMAPALCPG